MNFWQRQQNPFSVRIAPSFSIPHYLFFLFLWLNFQLSEQKKKCWNRFVFFCSSWPLDWPSPFQSHNLFLFFLMLLIPSMSAISRYFLLFPLPNPFVTSLSLFSKFSSAILIGWRLGNIFLNSWRTRRVVLTWWLYLPVVRLLGIQEIRSVLLLGMLMETRFCFLFLANFFVYIVWVKFPHSFSCVCLRRIVNKPIEIQLRHIWLLHLSFTFNFFSRWNLCS